MKKCAILFAIVLGLCIKFAAAEENYTKKHRFGFFGDYGYSFTNDEFRRLPEIDYYGPKFKSGDGVGFDFGGLMEIAPLADRDDLTVQLRLGYLSYSLDFSEDFEVSVPINGVSTDALVNHDLTTSFGSIIFEPSSAINLVDNLNLRLGFRATYVMYAEYDRIETLIEPAGETFSNGTNKRFALTGDIEKIYDLQGGLLGGFFYDIFLDDRKQTAISPEITFVYNFTPTENINNWKTSFVGAGLAVKYKSLPVEIKDIYERDIDIDTLEMEVDIFARSFSKGVPKIYVDTTLSRKERVITEYYSRTDTIFTEKATTPTRISIEAYKSKDTRVPLKTIRVEEFLSHNLKPILNYVFFDKNSSEIPERYVQISRESSKFFDPDALSDLETFELYYRLPDIVGYRMNQFPGAKIELIGANSGADENNNLALSRRRAQNLRNYLTDVWNIDSDRITISVRNLPSVPSNVNFPEGLEENRRVEIRSSDFSIIEPVFFSDTLLTSGSDNVFFVVRSENFDCVEGEFVAQAGSKTLKAIADLCEPLYLGDTNDDLRNETIEFDLKEFLREIGDSEFVVGAIGAKTVDGEVFIATDTIRVDKITIRDKQLNNSGDKRIDIFSLILFDFDASRLSENHRKIIDIVNEYLRPNSTIEVAGYTDRIGEETYNLNLSRRRAESVANELKKSPAKTVGFGESEKLYDNSLPEGRFYSRTVVITIVTPLGG